jgi:hypothetical protein
MRDAAAFGGGTIVAVAPHRGQVRSYTSSHRGQVRSYIRGSGRRVSGARAVPGAGWRRWQGAAHRL